MQRSPRQSPEFERNGRALCACSLIAIFLFSPAVASAGDKKPQAFVEGIRALDLGEWEKSAERMKVALDASKEDGERVRIYGTRYELYLPHYFRGLALYKLGRWEEAAKEWTDSISTGAVLKTDKYEPLRRYLFDCQQRLAPKAPPNSGSP